MTPAQVIALIETAAEKVPEPVWSALGDALVAAFRGDQKAAALHAQAAAARQAAHLALHAKEPSNP